MRRAIILGILLVSALAGAQTRLGTRVFPVRSGKSGNSRFIVGPNSRLVQQGNRQKKTVFTNLRIGGDRLPAKYTSTHLKNGKRTHIVTVDSVPESHVTQFTEAGFEVDASGTATKRWTDHAKYRNLGRWATLKTLVYENTIGRFRGASARDIEVRDTFAVSLERAAAKLPKAGPRIPSNAKVGLLLAATLAANFAVHEVGRLVPSTGLKASPPNAAAVESASPRRGEAAPAPAPTPRPRPTPRR